MNNEHLLSHIGRFVSLTDNEQAMVQSAFGTMLIKKKDFLLKESHVCHSNYFVEKGCLRLFYRTESGDDQIVQFAIDNWWMTDYMSFDSQQPSQFNIQAVENTEVAVLSKESEEELFKKIPALERYFRIILQKAYAASIMRLRYIFTQSGEERFHHFNSSFPEFVQRVPQYMLASYLGFTPEFLSKIRAKK